MKPKILLVNPPIYDFTAYDFWLKPYGMLSVAGFLRGQADFELFDYMCRDNDFYRKRKIRTGRWGRGPFHWEKAEKPAIFKNIPRRYRRSGLPRQIFRKFLAARPAANAVFIQTTMTYWYQGTAEVVEDIRTHWPNTKIILGGNYATLCPEHAKKMSIDLAVKGADFQPLWNLLGMKGDTCQPALYEIYDRLKTGVIKITDGCCFKCSYCSVPQTYGPFKPRPFDRGWAEIKKLTDLGATDIAFYDDALLYNADKVLIPFLKGVIDQNIKVNFHSPNALNARFITPETAETMVRAGFKTFYIGFESKNPSWQLETGGKVNSDELTLAVENLTKAGAHKNNITAYQILGHPNCDSQDLEGSIRYVASLGIKGMLADFSPIPGTPDGNACASLVDMAEPLNHNKTAFPYLTMNENEVNRLKDLQRQLNLS